MAALKECQHASVLHRHDKIHGKTQVKEERFVWGHSVEHFSPWLVGSIALEPMQRENIVVGGHAEDRSAHLMAAKKPEKGEGFWVSTSPSREAPTDLTSFPSAPPL